MTNENNIPNNTNDIIKKQILPPVKEVLANNESSETPKFKSIGTPELK